MEEAEDEWQWGGEGAAEEVSRAGAPGWWASRLSPPLQPWSLTFPWSPLPAAPALWGPSASKHVAPASA